MTKHSDDPSGMIFDLKQFGEYGDVNPSITDPSTYTFLSAQTMQDIFHGESEGCFLYSRHWNPSNKYLSDAMAALEGTGAGWVTASGMVVDGNPIYKQQDQMLCTNVSYVRGINPFNSPGFY